MEMRLQTKRQKKKLNMILSICNIYYITLFLRMCVYVTLDHKQQNTTIQSLTTKQKFILSVKNQFTTKSKLKYGQVPTTLAPRITRLTLEDRNLFISQYCYWVGWQLFIFKSKP